MGWILFAVIASAALIAGAIYLVNWFAAERLDAELTAYVAEGSMAPDTAKAILNTAARTSRKREVAALVATGMEPDQALILLDSMAAA